MKPLDEIDNLRLRRFVETLRECEVAKVRWSYIWYDDQADPDDIRFYDKDGKQMGVAICLYHIAEQELPHFSDDYGDFELNAYTGEIETLEWNVWRVPMESGGPGRDEWNVEPIPEYELESFSWEQCYHIDTTFCDGDTHCCNDCGHEVCDTHYKESTGCCVDCHEKLLEADFENGGRK